MRKIIHLLFISVLAVTAVSAQTTQTDQSVVLCESYDDFGTATGIYSTWNINLSGGYVYVVYKQIYAISANAMTLQVDKKVPYTENYLAYKTVAFSPESGKNWVMYDYFFSEAGDYRFTVVMDGQTKASTYASIAVVEDDENDDYSIVNGDTSLTTFYYENSYVAFCQSVVDGMMQGEAESFALGSNGQVEVTIYINNDKDFKTNLFYIDIYLDDELITDYNIAVEKNWDYAFVKQVFTKPGTYMVDVYNADDVFVNTGEITIY